MYILKKWKPAYNNILVAVPKVSLGKSCPFTYQLRWHSHSFFPARWVVDGCKENFLLKKRKGSLEN
jgi:hypothetical protein